MNAEVDTPDVSTSGLVDLIEDVRRGGEETGERARDTIDRMREGYARARVRRMVNLGLFVGLAYLLLRGKR